MAYVVAQGPNIPLMSSAKVLVLACIDPRYTAILNWFLTNFKNLKNDYDLFVLAGSSLGYNQSTSAVFAPVGSSTNVTYTSANIRPNWSGVFDDHIGLAKQLHGITEIWVFDHMGCGAFGHFLQQPANPETVQLHYGSIIKCINLINSSTSNAYNFKGFLIGLDAKITLTFRITNDSATAIDVEPNSMSTTINYYLVTFVAILVFLIFYNIN